MIFLLFQSLSRVPLVQIIQGVISPQLAASPALLYTWLAILVVTAGLFEEVRRYVGYHWLMRKEEKTWKKAVMYGLGHGGLESMLLVGGLAIFSLNGIIVVSSIDVRSLPAAQRAQVVQQLSSINAEPGWFPPLGV